MFPTLPNSQAPQAQQPPAQQTVPQGLSAGLYAQAYGILGSGATLNGNPIAEFLNNPEALCQLSRYANAYAMWRKFSTALAAFGMSTAGVDQAIALAMLPGVAAGVPGDEGYQLVVAASNPPQNSDIECWDAFGFAVTTKIVEATGTNGQSVAVPSGTTVKIDESLGELFARQFVVPAIFAQEDGVNPLGSGAQITFVLQPVYAPPTGASPSTQVGWQAVAKLIPA